VRLVVSGGVRLICNGSSTLRMSKSSCARIVRWRHFTHAPIGAHAMNIKLHNMDEDRVFTTAGPNVEFDIADSGRSIVGVTLKLSDGTLIHYPTGEGKKQLSSSLIAPGDYSATVVISATKFAFGDTYDTRILIGGTKAVSAKGTLPEDVPHDQDFEMFTLRVV
jgi:hypothetical protein